MNSEDISTRKRDDHHGVAEEIEISPDNEINEVGIPKLMVDNRKEFEAKFVRKLDMRLLPLMMLICMIRTEIRVVCIVFTNKSWKMF